MIANILKMYDELSFEDQVYVNELISELANTQRINKNLSEESPSKRIGS